MNFKLKINKRLVKLGKEICKSSTLKVYKPTNPIK